jgi:hypothetical protein
MTINALIDDRKPPDWLDWLRTVDRRQPVTRRAAFEAGKARGRWEAYQVMNAALLALSAEKKPRRWNE